MTDLACDYREANRELIESFGRYMEVRHLSRTTIRQRKATAARLAEFLGPRSLVQTERADIHGLMSQMLKHGLAASTINRETNGLRGLFKFLLLAGLMTRNPMQFIGRRKLPKRLPRVLTVEEVEAVIKAAKTPVEAAIVELLYGTALRVSELCSLKVEDVMFDERKIFVRNGKGGKDRLVFFGQHAENALRKYLKWRPSKVGYLFEVPERGASLYIRRGGRYRGTRWYVSFYASGRQHNGIAVGTVADLPTEEAAREAWKKIAAKVPDASPHKPTAGMPRRPYQPRAIRFMLKRMAHDAGIKGVHPHAFRRAAATHMLGSGGDIRAIQEFLGHARISTTQIYTTLSNEKVDEIYRKAHPHA